MLCNFSEIQAYLQQYKFLLIPIIGAFIGWVTNWIAVKMLFRPRRPVNLGFMKLQGVFPKRQEEVARKVSELVVGELLTESELKNKILAKFNTSDIAESIEEKIKIFLEKKVPELFPMLSMFVSPEILGTIATAIKPEIMKFIEQTKEKFESGFESTVDIKDTIFQKVKNFSSEKLEVVILAVMKKELLFVEYVGGILGFLIGVVQLLIS